MKIEYHIDKQLPEEKTEFWLHRMTDKIGQIANELMDKNDFILCYLRGDTFPVKISDIYLVQVENEKTYVYARETQFLYKGRLYQVQKLLSTNFVIISRSAVINYHKLDHLQILNNGNIDAILENKIRVQVSRRRVKDLKERLEK